jgi:ribonuclease D
MTKTTYQYIQTQETVLNAVQSLKNEKLIALDVEFDRDRFAYGFTLCLIQVYGNGITYLFDPFSLKDLQPVFDLFEDPKILKILHAPGEDLQLLNQFGCYPKNVFDTERSARLLDFSAFSLSNLLRDILGIELDKSQQKSDWTRSPLSPKQLEYAAADVAHLPELYERLMDMAVQKGVVAWIAEENASLDFYRAEIKPNGQLYNKDDAKKLPPFQLHVYNCMLQVRDVYAKQFNKPGYQIVDKHFLIDCVFHSELLEEWTNKRGIHPKLKNKEVANEFKQALEIGVQEAEKAQLPKFKTESRLSFEEREKAKARRDELKKIVDEEIRPIWQTIADDFGENTASYILNEKTMNAIASGELKISDLPYKYRKEFFSNR